MESVALKESKFGKIYPDKKLLDKIDLFLINSNLNDDQKIKLLELFGEVEINYNNVKGFHDVNDFYKD
jgi:hypothetical protein